jgi:Uma2 family endonuclease
MDTALRWTSADLDVLPDDDKRYEIIDGELYVSKQPHWDHQLICFRLAHFLESWIEQTGAGMGNFAPGLIFGDNDDVVPDLVWISKERLDAALDPAGHLHAAPELAVEVLSPGSANERRDREAKLKLYSVRGVQEYWIVDWRQRQVEVYRRQQAALRLAETLYDEDDLRSPLLPGFALPVKRLFAGI